MSFIIACLMTFIAAPTLAMEFHVTTAQELQVALAETANNGASDNIFLAPEYTMGGAFIPRERIAGNSTRI